MKKMQITQDANVVRDMEGILFFMLDKAIEDMVNGRVIPEAELWEKLDAIQIKA